MKIHLLAFATAADALGREAQLELRLPQHVATVGALKAHLQELYPDLAGMWSRLAVAIDGEVVGDDAKPTEGCEVALLPPVSGGRH